MATRHVSTSLSALVLALLTSSCGGSGGPPAGSAGPSNKQAADEEINAGDAVLVAVAADLAVSRYLAYREMTSTISSVALSYSPPIPSSAPCAGTAGGNLGITTLSPTSFDISLQSCDTAGGVLLQSGSVGIDNFSRTANGSSVSFDSTPHDARLVANIDQRVDDSVVSGSVKYSFSTNQQAGSGLPQSYDYRHSGDMNFAKAGKVDRYGNLSVTTNQTTETQYPVITVNVASLEVASPRVPVAKLLLTTPAPLVGDSRTGAVSGSIQAVSAKDGSRVQLDYSSQTSFRLRAWNSAGTSILDAVKNESDADVAAAAKALID